MRGRRTCATTRFGSSTPTIPARLRAYSSRSATSLIRATMGTPSASARTRPSAVSRSWPATNLASANSTSGRRRAMRSRTAASPWACRSSHGSIPPDSTAM